MQPPDPASATLIATVSRQLWLIDPINSGCHVNDSMEDEYDDIALRIVNRMQQRGKLRQAVEGAFDDAFWLDYFGTPGKRAALQLILAALRPVFRDASPPIQPNMEKSIR